MGGRFPLNKIRGILAIACLTLGVGACLLVPTSSALAAPDTIFGAATPTTIDSGDGHSVELGVKFTSEVPGSVTGIRFYKATTNVGTHIGSLWTTTGTLLASATFTKETASGWQQVNFATPVAIAANTTYIAAYLAPDGHYSDSVSAFTAGGVSSPPLSALANSVSPNGVYTYSTTSTFPTATYKATNYWVDADFEPTPTTAPGQVTNVTATAGPGSATVTWSAPSSGSPAASYTITPYAGATAQPTTTVTGAPPATSTTVEGLTSGTSYTFTVQAANSAGAGPPSAPSNAVTPTAARSIPVRDASVTVNGHGTVTTPSFSTVEAGEQLLAFVASDGPSGAAKQSATVSGAGLTWTLVKRANAQSGDAEIWRATAPSPLSDVTVTSTPAAQGYDQSLTVISLELSKGVGASVVGGAASGAPSVSLATTEEGSLVYAVGNDWDAAGARTLGPSQTMLDQYLDTKAGNTFWSQYTSQPAGAAGTVVTLNDTAPTNDMWNMAAVEVLAASKSTATAPGQVTDVSAAAGDGSATLTWVAPANGGSPITSYTITPYIGSAAQTATKISGSPPATSATIAGLTSGTSYTFTVTASNAVGVGPASEHSNAVTPTAPTAPAAPTEVIATAGEGNATVTWAAPASGGSAITQYTITPYIGSTAQPASTVTGSPPTTSATIAGLTDGTTYTFTVSATNAVGTGPPSSSSNAVTPSGGAIAYPDLQVLMPTGDIAVVQDGSARTLEFTHISEDAGAGPWELRPVYNPETGISQGYQALYTMPSPGVWKYAYSVPTAGPMIWSPPVDYTFPLDKFWLYNTATGGGPGTVVATSPKVQFCMTSDTYVGGVPNTPVDNEYPGSNCEKPEGRLGLSVGWGDQYEATDGGEGIPITSLPNGTYWLRGEIDPYHYFEESNTSNNITDTKLEITGDTVKVLEQTHPNSTPPTVTLTSPSANAALAGTATLSATASGPAAISSVQFLLDGEPIGSPVTTPPYTINWSAGNVTPGKHYLTAQATDSNGFIGTAPEVPVTVSGKVGSVTIADVVSQTGTTTATTPAFSTTEPGEILLAFADSDGPATGSQTLGVSGAGLSWSLVKRSNSQAGDAEIWTATTVASLLNATVTATAADSGYKQSLTVVALSGAYGVGASAAASAAKGAPSIGLTATEAGSVAFATGDDSAGGTARTLGAGQELLAQTVEASAGDTYWSQYATTPSSAAGQTLTLDDTAPTTDPWDLAAVEVLPSPPEQSGAEPPSVSIVNPTAGEIVSGTAQVTANVSDNAPIGSVQFYLDGKPLGAPVTKAPYAISWDTTEASNAAHSLTATATNTSNMTGTSSPVSVTVQNPPEEETCFVMDVTVNATGRGAVTTQTFTTAEAGEQLYAFVSSDGPAGAAKQSATVSGAGLTWTLVKRANSQSGDAEIWTAEAKTELSDVTVTSTPAVGGYDQSLTVISMQGSNGSGASVAGGATSGAPSVSLTTEQAGSLVYAVGSDWDNATSRTLGPNQTLLRQDLDTAGGNTFWSQFTSAITGPAGGVVTMNDTEPTSDDWNMAAVEIVSDVAGG
jgi:hypothetical protein